MSEKNSKKRIRLRNNSNNQRFLFVERQVERNNRIQYEGKQWENNKKKNLKNTKTTTQLRNPSTNNHL